MPASRLSESFLAYCRTGAYMATLPPPDRAAAELPPAPWPSAADLNANLESHYATAPCRSVAEIVNRRQPSRPGSVVGESPSIS